MTTFQKRRQQLSKTLDENTLVLIASGLEKQKNSHVCYPFRADSDFYYLTGISEPQCVAILSQQTFTLFLRPYDATQVLWMGERLGLEGAIKQGNANAAYDIKALANKLPDLLKEKNNLHHNLDAKSALYQTIKKCATKQKTTLKPVPTQLHEMRLLKTETEIKQMQHAADISVEAHQKVMQTVRANLYEYQINALLDYQFQYHNAQYAYPSIVASGKNACTLHYISNQDCLNDGDLLLIDAGAEFNGYAADITRTLPVNGRFSAEQASIYQLVLKAQKKAIATIKPGASVKAPHQVALTILTQGLIDLGLLSGSVQFNIDNKLYQQFFMHNTGHFLGLDVHDVGAMKINNDWRVFQVGMVMTVEPGIYIRPSDNVAKKWWHIGVRIEDDVLVTENGNRVLTEKLVKEIADIEAIMRA